MLDKEFYVLAFDSTHYAINTEKKLKEHLKIETIPTPREISTSCGLSIKFGVELLDKVMELVKEDLNNMKLYRIVREGIKKNVYPMSI
ncbi:DUF3343 domain-containing protein [Anaeromicrobium sediminis]|uniref:Putative Se/S carrier protein-like domain-containing protein n=1 Tax=Anaeromicrobium sediminis TaxID=1478221 RepID=A0A267MHR1_9FIRM|nr:DUF3343 domain-containing protein [Anaeromicrobium sediminis]PAB58468.1 hypothetical protein CCE28_15285 [Anaeromicrobium sediminis]